jgi:hypothetical protein
VACMGEERKLCKVSVGMPKGKRPLGRQRHRWKNGMRIYLKEIGWGVWSGLNWLGTGTSGGLL